MPKEVNVVVSYVPLPVFSGTSQPEPSFDLGPLHLPSKCWRAPISECPKIRGLNAYPHCSYKDTHRNSHISLLSDPMSPAGIEELDGLVPELRHKQEPLRNKSAVESVELAYHLVCISSRIPNGLPLEFYPNLVDSPYAYEWD